MVEDEERTQLVDSSKAHALQKGKGLIVGKRKFRVETLPIAILGPDVNFLGM